MSIRERDSLRAADDARGLVARGLACVTSLIWWAILALLVLFALYAGIGRQLTANINSFSSELSASLSEATGLEITVGSLSSQWYWLEPAITAKDITIHSPDSDRIAAELEHLELRLDFFASLYRFRLVFRNFDADGLALTVVRSTKTPFINPVDDFVEQADLDEAEVQHWIRLAGRWLSNPEVRVTRVSLALGPSRQNLRFLDIPQLDLSYHGGLFQAEGRAMQSGTATQLASFALVGVRLFRGEFTGQLYLDVDSGRLFDGLIDDLNWRGIRVEGFDLGGSAWLSFKDGELQQVQGQIRTPYLQLGINRESLAPLEDIQAHFGWRQGEALRLQKLRWDWIGDQVLPFSVRIEQGQDELKMVADSVPVKPLRRLVQALDLLPAAASEALEHYQPSGFLDDMFFTLPEQATRFSLRAKLREFGVQAWSGAPHVEGIYGSILMDAHGGKVTLATPEPVVLGFPQLFNTDWTLDSLSGTVAWTLADGITRVFSDDLELVYQADTRLTGAFDLRLDRYGEDNLGLSVGVEGGKAAMLADFVPANAVSEGLYEWLSSSISEARIRGRYYGHGRIDSAAPSGAFVSSMWYEFEDARIRYDQRWPAVEQARGRVEVQNTYARVSVAEGVIGGLKLEEAAVRVIPEDGEGGTLVRVDAASKVPGDRVPWWLNNTPLGELLGYGNTQAIYEGEFELNLGLDIPLSQDQSPRVTAQLKTDNAGFSLPDTGLRWQNIQADLTYDSVDGFSGPPVTARFFDQPVSVVFSTPKSRDVLNVRQEGSVKLPGSLAAFGLSDDIAPGLTGELIYTAELELGGASQPLISLYSDLEGLRVDWPQPLAKTERDRAPLFAKVDPFHSDGIVISAQWQDRLDAELRLEETGFELVFGYLNLGAHHLTDITLTAHELNDRWVVHTDSDRARGRVVLPKEAGTVVADFETLHLVRDTRSGEEDTEILTLEEHLQAFQELDMEKWPDIDAKIQDLRLDGKPAGSWSFKLRPETDLLRVQDMEGRLGSLVLSGDMVWGIVDNREGTRFSGKLVGGALKDLESLTGNTIPMTNKETAVELDLDWPGSPADIAFSNISGAVSARLDDGMIMEQSSSAQLFRIFNLLNTDTLWRRLQLDFTDLYERGIAFDAISGKASIVDGLMTMDPELQLVGPSGAFKLSGHTNLVDETLDMRLVLVLPVTQNLPLAAILMGASAPIGGALFVLDKILGDPLSKLTSATYSVTGTWSDPEVNLRGVFDTGE